jgi:hypothetical protein
MEANYLELLEEYVFTQPNVDRTTKKMAAQNERLLKSLSANRVLLILWKESSYIAASDLDELKKGRSFDGEITVHALAVALAESPADVAALNSRIRSIALAGEAFGLVEKQTISATRVFIRGTALLNEFMVQLGQANLRACEELLITG